MQETLFTKKDPREHAILMMPHLKKFALKHYRLKEPVKLEEKTIMGTIVLMTLMDKRMHHGGVRIQSIAGYHGAAVKDPLSERLRVVLNDEMIKRSPRANKLIRVNLYLNMLFKESMVVWIDSHRNMGVPPNTSVKLFLEHYSIEESEYSYDAAYKHWQRFNSLKKG